MYTSFLLLRFRNKFFSSQPGGVPDCDKTTQARAKERAARCIDAVISAVIGNNMTRSPERVILDTPMSVLNGVHTVQVDGTSRVAKVNERRPLFVGNFTAFTEREAKSNIFATTPSDSERKLRGARPPNNFC